MKIHAMILFCLLLFGFQGFTKDRLYQATLMYEADDAGRVLKQNPYSGTIILRANGTYHVQLYFTDEGKYQLVKASQNQPNDILYFYSSKGYKYFAYPKEKMMAIWLNKPRQGINLWVNAYLDSQAKPSVPSNGSNPVDQIVGKKGALLQKGLISQGRFTRTVMFTTTSAGSYFNYDVATGEFSHDQTGVVFRPDGSYSLRAEFGFDVTVEKGNYTIRGRAITLQFSDRSTITLHIADNNRDLHWYSNNMLISEFFFLKIL